MRLLMPRLSVIIVTYNSVNDLDACLTSLTGNSAPVTDHEIVVVDNASADGTAAYLRDRWPGVRLIEAGRNLGFAAGNNVGIRQTFGELVLLLNPDTIVPRGAIDRLVAALDARPSAAIVGPRIVDRQGRAELSFGRMISPLVELRQKVLVAGNDRGWPFIGHVVERMTARPRRVDWVSGACLLIRRADLEAVGLFDERFFMYTEDVDLCAAVRARGRDVLFEPSAQIIHLRGRSVARAFSATQSAYRRSQIAFYGKHHPRWVKVLKWYLRARGEI
jgi:N-acetylglucosaminyl-diphospho-decaprenol L-rhamnosyltransferase